MENLESGIWTLGKIMADLNLKKEVKKVVEKVVKKVVKKVVATDINTTTPNFENGHLDVIAPTDVDTTAQAEGCTEAIEENLTNIEEKGSYIFIPQPELLNENEGTLYLTAKENFKLAMLVHSTVLKIMPSFIELNKYFDEMINILEKLNLPMS